MERTLSAIIAPPLARGLLLGFLGFGPLAGAVFLAAQHPAAGPWIPALPLPTAPPSGFPDPLLVAQVKSANRAGSALVMGSSEFRGQPSLQTLLESAGTPFPSVVGFVGSAVWRSVFLLERTAVFGVAPNRLIVVVNPYYAHENAQTLERSVGAYFPDEASSTLHRCRMRQSAQGSCSVTGRLLLKTEMFRALLTRRVVVPTTGLLRHGRLYEHAAAAAARPGANEPKAALRIPELEGHDFGRSLLALRAALLRNSSTRALLLLLPLNRAVYEHQGLRPAEHERRFFHATRRIAGVVADVMVLDKMRDPILFSDPVHYTARGRAQLARAVITAEAAWRAAARPR